MNRISVMADGFRLGIQGGLDAAKRVGAGAVQIGVGERGAVTSLWTGAFRREVLARLNDNGLAVSAMCGDLGGHGFQSRDDNDWRIEETRRMMELTRELGSGILTSHIGVIPEDDAHPRRAIMLEAMLKLSEYAQQSDCRVAIETGPERPEVLLKFLSEVPNGFIGVNYDPANLIMVLKDVDPIKGVYTLKDHIFHTHAKDGKMLKYVGPEVIYGFFADGGIGDLRMEEHFIETPLGDGDVDLHAWLGALKDIGYEGYLTIEREVGSDPMADIQKAVNFLKSQL